MMDLHEEDLFKVFDREIIQHKEDTRNERWKYKCDKLVRNIAKHKINLLSPKDCISQAVSVTKPDIIQAVDDLENAFYCISQYAINLCRDPHRPEYSIIKTYTGYYASNILSVMNGIDSNILISMGYVIKPYSENNDEFVLGKVGRSIKELAFQLFLAQPYCRFIKELCQNALDRRHPIEAIEYTLGFDVDEILKHGVDNLCEQWYKNKPKVSVCDNPENYRAYQHIQANSEQLTDEELYGPPSMGVTDIDNESEIYHTKLTSQIPEYKSPVSNFHENPYYEPSSQLRDTVNPLYESTSVRHEPKISSIKINITHNDGITNRVKIGEQTVKDNESQKLYDSPTQSRSIEGRISGKSTPSSEIKLNYPPAFKPSTYED